MILLHGSAVVAAPVSVFVDIDGEQREIVGSRSRAGGYLFNSGAEKNITLATLNWAPYIAEDICGQGWVQQLVVAALVKQNYSVEVFFLPWKRAVAMAETGKVDALFPEYTIAPNAPSDIVKNKKRLDMLMLSEPFPGGSVVFWRRKGSGIEFDGNLLALKNVAIGVVAGYENTPEFDALMEQRYFAINSAVDDWFNVRMLYNGRIDLIVGDPLVLTHAVRANLPMNQAQKYLDALETVEPHLAEHPLFLAFSKSVTGFESKLEDFNSAIYTMRETGEIERIRNKYQDLAHLTQSCQP